MNSDVAIGDGGPMVGDMMRRFELLQRKLVPMWRWIGRLGATSIADTYAEADALHQRFVKALDDEAEKALNVFRR